MNGQSVIFDLDNTLTQRRQSVTAFARQFWADFGSKLAPIEFAALENLIQDGDGGGYRPKAEMFAILSTDLPWLKPMSADTMREYWYRESPACMVPRTGMMTLLDMLHQHDVRLGMITNGKTAVQNATIDTLGIRQYFEVILISEEVGIRKPDCRIFEMALEALDSKPEMTWYMGDNPQSDVMGGHDAGLRTVWMSDGREWEVGLSRPDYQIEELGELLDILELYDG